MGCVDDTGGQELMYTHCNLKSAMDNNSEIQGTTMTHQCHKCTWSRSGLQSDTDNSITLNKIKTATAFIKKVTLDREILFLDKKFLILLPLLFDFFETELAFYPKRQGRLASGNQKSTYISHGYQGHGDCEIC